MQMPSPPLEKLWIHIARHPRYNIGIVWKAREAESIPFHACKSLSGSASLPVILTLLASLNPRHFVRASTTLRIFTTLSGYLLRRSDWIYFEVRIDSYQQSFFCGLRTLLIHFDENNSERKVTSI